MKLYLERVRKFTPIERGSGEGSSKGGQQREGTAVLDLSEGATVRDLKEAFSKVKTKYGVHRQEWRLAPKPGQGQKQKKGEVLRPDHATLASYGLRDGATVYFKDLGVQIGYRTVFFWEYLGPLLIYPLFFLFPFLFYSSSDSPTTTAAAAAAAAAGGGGGTSHAQTNTNTQVELGQKVACAYWVFHYAKRIFETFFVHKFSHSTMPVRNLVKNCSYYWGFAALVSYFVNSPSASGTSSSRSLYIYVCFTLAMLCQVLNLYCHVALTRLRKPGETAYKIPRGFLFDVVTCPNYTTEVMGWFFFNVGTRGTIMGVAFMMAGAVQMYQWAVAKHKRLNKIFDGKEGRAKYPRRYIMFPPFL